MSLLSAIGSLVGMVTGGPAGAALGSGLGTLLGGGSLSDAFQTGIGTLLTGGLGGKAGIVADLLGGGGSSQAAGAALFDAFRGGGGGGGGGNNALASLIPGLGGQPQQPAGAGPQAQGGQAQGGLGGLMQAFDNPLMIAALLKATEPKNVNLLSPEQQRQMQTGERLPDYRGTPAFDYRYARGGFVKGPGSATSDSIPARIYQGGRPVQEARLSDGEFVMTNRAVRGAGNGDRAKGAAEMYRMMRQFERRA